MIKNILWDFDGVILDSMPVREYGFRKIFEEYNIEYVEKLLEYHNKNGGLSRYVKIRYFFEEILKESIDDEKIQYFANNFSYIMKKELINRKYLIVDTMEFITQYYKKYNFHIVSGSDEKELQYLCKELEIEEYFISINGSPTPKNKLVKNLLLAYDYHQNETILIGDSINDYEASKINNLDFYGFNNTNLKELSKEYLSCYKRFYI